MAASVPPTATGTGDGGSTSPAAIACGVTDPRPYDLRHSFVSLLIHEGGSIVEVARQGGHSPKMALDTYAHVFDEFAVEDRLPAEEQIRRARSAEDVPLRTSMRAETKRPTRIRCQTADGRYSGRTSHLLLVRDGAPTDWRPGQMPVAIPFLSHSVPAALVAIRAQRYDGSRRSGSLNRRRDWALASTECPNPRESAAIPAPPHPSTERRHSESACRFGVRANYRPASAGQSHAGGRRLESG